MKKLDINIYEILAAVIGLLLLGVVIFTLNYKPVANPDTKKVNISIAVTTDKSVIKDAAEKQKQVYFGGSNTPVDLVSVVDGDKFVITLSGLGKITDNAYYFNGQRILIGQKVEIHSTYFARGLVTSVSYAN